MYIDCHVHCRDFEESYKETIGNALRIAEGSKLSAIFDMPNTNPLVTNKETAEERLALAKITNSPVFYGTYIGITQNKKQIEQAIETWNEFFPKNPEEKYGVIGFKMFAGKSIGNLTVSEEKEQFEIYKNLYDLNYKGVLVVHCEKESEINEKLWNLKKPISHCIARPKKAEIESIKDQLKFADESKFCEKGKLHIAHVSTPESVELINKYKNSMPLSCGVTPHHLLLNNEIMKLQKGILYKVNPPLRDKLTQESLLEQFINGKIDILESDHAPHNLKENKEGISGIPNLSSWPIFIELLKKRGAKNELLEKVAFENINKIFNTKIKKLKFPSKTNKQPYAFEPYRHLVEN
jgi:dihydroorotase